MKKRPVLFTLSASILLITTIRHSFSSQVLLLCLLPGCLYIGKGRGILAGILISSVFFSAGQIYKPDLYKTAERLSRDEHLFETFVEDASLDVERTSLTLRILSIDTSPPPEGIEKMRLTIFESSEILPGKILRFTVRPNLPDEKRNPGGFDERAYLLSKGIRIDASLNQTGDVKFEGEQRTFFTFFRSLRIRMINRLHSLFPEKEASFASALLFGADADSQTEELFRSSGLSHVLAVSGLHVGIIAGILAFLCRRLPLYLRIGFTATFLILYYLLTGLTPSATRAVFMCLLLLLAPIWKRPYDLFTSLLISAQLYLLICPALLYDAGFLLSFAAVLGISLFYRPMRTRFRGGGIVIDSLLLSLAALSVTLPVTLYFFGKQTLLLFFTNILITPFAPLLLGLILVSLAISVFPIPANPACAVFVYLFEKITYALKVLNTIPAPVLYAGKAGYLACAFLILILFALSGYFGDLKGRIRLPGRFMIRKLLGVSILFSSLLILLFMLLPGREIRITFLDIGQGNAALLETREGVYLIDGGGYETSASFKRTPISQKVLLPALQSRGIRYIDAAFITHNHADHAQGIEELIEEPTVEVRDVYVNSGYNGSLPEIVKLKKGDRLGEKDGLAFEVLSPLYSGVQTDEEQNEHSLVLKVSCPGLELYFPGDIGIETEEVVAKELKKPPQGVKRILVAPHHGSSGSGSTALFDTLSPDLIVISCGLNNRYGHPAEDFLLRAQGCGSRILRTDHNGAILVRERFGKVYISSYLGEAKNGFMLQ